MRGLSYLLLLMEDVMDPAGFLLGMALRIGIIGVGTLYQMSNQRLLTQISHVCNGGR
jgi:hypothetical protein